MATKTRPPEPASDTELVDIPEMPQEPTILDEACWAVCPHIQRWASPTLKECLRYPVWEMDPIIGRSKRVCRINAEKAALAVLGIINRRWAATGQTSKRKGKA